MSLLHLFFGEGRSRARVAWRLVLLRGRLVGGSRCLRLRGCRLRMLRRIWLGCQSWRGRWWLLRRVWLGYVLLRRCLIVLRGILLSGLRPGPGVVL